MLSLAILDAIADAFNPVAGIISLALVATPLVRLRWGLALLRASAFGVVLAVVYAFMLADRIMDPNGTSFIGYSTHSAFAIGACAFNSTAVPRLAAPWVVALIAYLGLVVYQGYHPVGDVAFTAALVLAPFWFVLWLPRRQLAGASA